MALDRIDRQILSLLQADGRMTNVELADRVGLTAPPCLRRVRALEEAGAIKGYHAELDPATLGCPSTVFAIVSLKTRRARDLAGVRRLLDESPGLVHAGDRGTSQPIHWAAISGCLGSSSRLRAQASSASG